MKLATLNINGINQRIDSLLTWLAASNPDIVCLKAIHDAGYGAVWHGQTSWNGVAILAKRVEPIETRRQSRWDKGNEEPQPIAVFHASFYGAP